MNPIDRASQRDQDLNDFFITHTEKYPEFYPNDFDYQMDMFMMDKLIRDNISVKQELFGYEATKNIDGSDYVKT